MDIDNCNIHENGGDCLRDVMNCNWCHEKASFLCKSPQSDCSKHTDHMDQTVIILTLRHYYISQTIRLTGVNTLVEFHDHLPVTFIS